MTPIQITYTLTPDDFVDAHRVRRAAEPAQRWSMRVLYALVFLLVVSGLGMFAIDPTRETMGRVIPLFVFAVAWVLVVRYVPARIARRAFTSQAAAQEEQTTEFSEQGIRTQAGDGRQSRIAWSQVLRWSEGERVFLLYLTPKLFVVYPKRAMDAAQVMSLRELLKERLGE